MLEHGELRLLLGGRALGGVVGELLGADRLLVALSRLAQWRLEPFRGLLDGVEPVARPGRLTLQPGGGAAERGGDAGQAVDLGRDLRDDQRDDRRGQQDGRQCCEAAGAVGGANEWREDLGAAVQRRTGVLERGRELLERLADGPVAQGRRDGLADLRGRDLAQRVLGIQLRKLGLERGAFVVDALSARSALSRASSTACCWVTIRRSTAPRRRCTTSSSSSSASRRLPRMCSTRLAHRLPSA